MPGLVPGIHVLKRNNSWMGGAKPAPTHKKRKGRTMRRALTASVLTVALLSFAGTAHAADELKVGTPEGTAFMFAVLDVGNGAGIFAKHDLAVEKLNFACGGKLGEAISAGAVDRTISGNPDMASA